MADELRQNLGDFTLGSDYNAMTFFVRSVIRGTVNVALPVVVTAVTRPLESGAAGYVTVKPMIMRRSAAGDSLASVEIPRLPFFRYQHGTAAFIADPEVGDIGLAVCAQQDASLIKAGNTEPVAAGSFRSYDFSDAFYLGGFYGNTPTTYIKVESDGSIEVIAPASVTVKSPAVTVEADTVDVTADTVTITASSSVTLDTPSTVITGTLSTTGSKGTGASVSGDLETTGDVTAGSVSLQSHVHSGVESGSSTTGAPVA